jgi:hypothetical protein
MRSFSVRVAVLLALLTACSPAPASEVAHAAEALPEARALVERFLAVTRHEVVARSRSRHARARITLPEGGGSIESFARRPMELRQRTELGELGSFESGITDGRAWMHSQGGAALLAGVELLLARFEGCYDAATRPAEQLEALMTLARVPFEGVDCWQVVVVARASGGLDAEATLRERTSHEYYEVASGLLRGQEGTAAGELSGGAYRRVFGDYRELAGTLVPTRVVLSKDGIEVVTTLESLEFDGVSEADLAPPLAIQRLLAAEAAEDLAR